MLKLRQATETDLPSLKELWQDSFQDTAEYTDWYFANVVPRNVIFVAEQDGVVAAMLHLNPYELMVKGAPANGYYIVGVATKKGYRRKGFMKLLMDKAFAYIKDSGGTFAYLMPADTRYYTSFGFKRLEESWNLRISAKMARKAASSSYAIVSYDEVSEGKWQAYNEALSKRYDIFAARSSAYMAALHSQCEACGGKAYVVVDAPTGNVVATYGTFVSNGETEVCQYICVRGDLKPLLATIDTGFKLEYFGETPDASMSNMVTGEGHGIMYKSLSENGDFASMTGLCINEIV